VTRLEMRRQVGAAVCACAQAALSSGWGRRTLERAARGMFLKFLDSEVQDPLLQEMWLAEFERQFAALPLGDLPLEDGEPSST
jgi:hypothetical protein